MILTEIDGCLVINGCPGYKNVSVCGRAVKGPIRTAYGPLDIPCQACRETRQFKELSPDFKMLPDSAPWGTIYGLPYDLPDGRRVWMCRGKRNHVRFYTAEGEQVGPEQSNVAPAVAFALSRGWRQADHG